jgi:hypothetical protein
MYCLRVSVIKPDPLDPVYLLMRQYKNISDISKFFT